MTLMVKILKFNIRSFSRPDNFKTETYNFEEDKQDSDDYERDETTARYDQTAAMRRDATATATATLTVTVTATATAMRRDATGRRQ